MNRPIIGRAAALVAALFAGILAATCFIMVTDPKAVDFLSFWAAGRMAAEGSGPQFYDVAAHSAVQRAAVASAALQPFPYPPPFALLLAPFGLLPYGLAFTAWVAVTGALYVHAARCWMPRRIALAQPAVLINGFIGQNAFLTSALVLAGLDLLKRRPLLAGALLGLLVIKPQLALMLPVALLAGRHWRAIAAGALSACAALLAGLAAFGSGAYAAFFELLSTYAGFVQASRWPWHELASVYAFLRYFGAGDAIALSLHLAVAAGAAVMVWNAWRQNRPGKEAILAASTLLVPPYLLSYDGVLLGLPVAALLVQGRQVAAAGVWGLSLLTIGTVAGFYAMPNTVPLAAVLALVLLYGAGKSGIGGKTEALAPH